MQRCAGAFDPWKEGVDYLITEVDRVVPGSPIRERCLSAKNRFQDLGVRYLAKGQEVPPQEASSFGREYEVLSSLGFYLWLVREYRSKGYEFELARLAEAGNRISETDRLIRSHGFLFFSAGELVKRGFEISIVEPSRSEPTADLFAVKDTIRFDCEVTTKDPAAVLEGGGPAEFWKHVLRAVRRKKQKFIKNKYAEGVLVLDCTEVWNPSDGAGFGSIPITSIENSQCPDEPMFIANRPGPKKGRLVDTTFPDTEFEEGLRKLEDAVRGTTLRNLMLWFREFTVDDNTSQYRKREGFNVIGALSGWRFWSNFTDPFIPIVFWGGTTTRHLNHPKPGMVVVVQSDRKCTVKID